MREVLQIVVIAVGKGKYDKDENIVVHLVTVYTLSSVTLAGEIEVIAEGSKMRERMVLTIYHC